MKWSALAAVILTLFTACVDSPLAPVKSYRSTVDCVRDYYDQSQCSTVTVTADPTSSCDVFGNCSVNCNVYPQLCDQLVGGGGGGGGGG